MPKIILRIKKGGAGSGHHGHAGRPGKVGGSSPSGSGSVVQVEPSGRIVGDTVTVRIGSDDVILDTKIADLTIAMNEVGLRTHQSCSGHTCSDPVSAHITYHITNGNVAQDAHDSIKSFIDSGDLNLDWELDNYNNVKGWYELHLLHGLFGDQTLQSTQENIDFVHQDIEAINSVISK